MENLQSDDMLRQSALAGKPNLVYFNKPQLECQWIAANTTVLVAGRRTGKTDSVAAPFMLRNMQRMKGSVGGIVVPTFRHGLTNTIPGLLAAWNRWGWREGIHYVVGKQPPKWFGTGVRKTLDNEHVIHFYNGSSAVILSQDRPGAANSLTLSWLLIDEARFIDHLKLKQEVFPANGGIKNEFSRHSCNHSILILSDMPQTSRGSWFLNYREKMDPELIECIKATIHEIWRVKERVREMQKKGVTPPAYIRKYLRTLDARLNKMRSVAVYYKECSTIENLQLIGENYIKQMERDLTPLTFQTSILCKRIGLTSDGFYSSMKEEHKYDASDLAFLDNRFHQGNFSGDMGCEADSDLDPDAPICIGMDYNANINWIVAGQPDTANRRLLVLKSFFVKFKRKIPELIGDFCRYYERQRNKTVVFYYDSTALGSNYAVNDQDFQTVIKSEFEKHGWRVIAVYLGNPMRHNEKYLLINQAFAGNQRLQPFFNRQNNEDLLLAIQCAGVERGRNGFRKYKAGEKLQESEENLLEHRTDGTDAFDTLFIGCEKFPQQSVSVLRLSGIY